MGKTVQAPTETHVVLVGARGDLRRYFAGASYALAPHAPGKAELRREWSKRTTDQHYSGRGQARANNRENIASWKPICRDHMDGDGDGLAGELYLFGVSAFGTDLGLRIMEGLGLVAVT